MNEFVQSHTYLFSLLVWLFFYLVLFIINYRHWKSILFSSLAALPQAFFAMDLVPKAWVPDRIFDGPAGIEDFLFCFLAGGLVWMSVLWLIGKNSPDRISLKQSKNRLVFCIIFGIAGFTVLFLAGIDGYLNPFLIMIAWSLVVILKNRDFWKIGLAGTVSFFVIWVLILIIIIQIWPEIPSLWSWDRLWGIGFLGFPIEELIWAVLYGLSWSLAVAYILNIKMEPKVKIN